MGKLVDLDAHVADFATSDVCTRSSAMNNIGSLLKFIELVPGSYPPSSSKLSRYRYHTARVHIPFRRQAQNSHNVLHCNPLRDMVSLPRNKSLLLI
jgi:hypothetical protein